MNLRHRFGDHTVLDLAALHVAGGEHALVLGPSGCGKSTLLHLIAGLLRPTSGQILVAEQDITRMSAAALDAFRGQTIGIVLQNLHLIEALTLTDNLRLAQTLAGQTPDPDRLRRVMGELGLANHAKARPSELSHGEAQRAAIARAVINRPRLILADEPTSALDDGNCAVVLHLLRAQAETTGATLVVVTHDGRLTPQFANRVDLGRHP